MSGHRHNPNAATQNQGNSLGDRSCVRQSKLYRMYESGNDVKAILGSGHLSWDPNVKQGAYAGQKVYDHTQDDTYQRRDDYGRDPARQQQYSNGGGARRGNNENEYPTSKNSLSHYARQDERQSDYSQKGADSYQSNSYGGSNARRQPQQYNNEDYSGGRGASSGGGATSFSIGQSDYSYGRNDAGDRDHRKRRDYEPAAGANDNFPLNKMGVSDRGSNNSNYRSSYGGAEDSSATGSGRGGGSEERTGSGGYRSLKDQINQNANSSSFQSQRRKSSEYAAESVARTYFPQQQQERSTRPW